LAHHGQSFFGGSFDHRCGPFRRHAAYFVIDIDDVVEALLNLLADFGPSFFWDGRKPVMSGTRRPVSGLCGRAWPQSLPGGGAGFAHLGCHYIRVNKKWQPGPELRPFLGERMCQMPNLETYREKAVKCVRAADEVHNSGERAELLGLASVYMALADYVDRQNEPGATTRSRVEQPR